MKFILLLLGVSIGATAHANLLSNPGFESSLTGWTNYGTGTVVSSPVRTGSKSARVGGATGGLYQVRSFTPGSAYTLSGWGSLSSAGEVGYFGVTFKNSLGQDVAKFQTTVTATSFAQKTINFTAPASFSRAEVWVWKASGFSSLYVDDLSLIQKLPTTTTSTTCTGTGSITHEKWGNTAGGSISTIPLSTKPASTVGITKLETTTQGDSYGSRISGYICPPVSGNYTFYISGDDSAKLSLSTSDLTSGLRQIAYTSGYTDYRQINKYTTQKSTLIALTAGKKYYIEVLHKEDGGGDHVSVGWDMPNGTRELPLPASRIAPRITTTSTSTQTTPTTTGPSKGDSFDENAVTYSAPIVITRGGTYRGNWQSRNSAISAVEIRTNEPVVIENSVIRSAGYLIRANAGSTNLVVRNSRGYGLTPTADLFEGRFRATRKFLNSSAFKKITLENNYMENTAGILIADGYTGTSASDTIIIRNNKVKNIDGRIYGGWQKVNFLQLHYGSRGVPGIDISWNQIVNEPGNSVVEDNINLLNARGTSASPMMIRNNYIEGAYPLLTETKGYSGGGILSDSVDTPPERATAFVDISYNQVVSTMNYSFGIAGGNNIKFYKNRAVTSDYLPNGKRAADVWTSFSINPNGYWSKEYYMNGSNFNNLFDSNVVGISRYSNRNDGSFYMEGAEVRNMVYLPAGPVTLQMQSNEYNIFSDKVKSNGVHIGPR